MATDQEALLLQFGVQLNDLQKQMDRAVGVVSDGGARMVLKSKESMAAIEKSYGSIDASGFAAGLEKMALLQDRLALAQAEGNRAEAKSLREQLVLQQAVQKAGAAQLETQLAIARAAGSKAQVAQLSEALAVQSQFSRLQSVGLTGSKALHEAEAAVVALAAAEKAAEGANVGKALTSVFDNAKLATLEEGSTKLRLFGSALEPLGAAGIAAAAGVVAFGVSLEEAHKAVEFADSLYKLAKNAHVTTDELQQMQYALRVSGGNAADASAGLQSFSATLGKAQAGLPKAQKGFLELGFTKAQIKGWDDAGTALDAVVEKIAGLKSNAQKDAVIEQLGLDQLKPLIEGGIDKWREFKAEAVDAGLVMDASLIKRGHELNEQLETLHTKIDVDLKTAFIELGPILVQLAGLLADMAAFARDVADGLSSIDGKSSDGLSARAVTVSKELLILKKAQADGSGVSQVAIDNKQKELEEITAEQQKRRADNKPVAPPSGGGGLTDLSHHATPTDQTASFDKSAQDAYDSGLKALIEAQKALTGDIQVRADAEKAAIQADLDKKLTDLAAEEAKIRAAKIDAHKVEQLALIEKAKTEEQNAALAKKEKIDRDTAFAVEDRTIELYKSKVDAQISELTAQGSIASTAKERAQIELKILALRQQLERDLHDQQIDRRTHTETNPGGDLTPEQAARLKGDFNATQGAQGAAQRYQIAINADPVLKYLDSLRDVGTFMKTEGVTALDGFAGGIADIVANGAKAGDVLRSLVRQLLYDFTKRNLQTAESTLLGKFGVKLPDSGAATGAAIATQINTAGTTAGTSIATQFTAAGAEVAAQIAAAMAAGGVGGGASGFNLGSLFSGSGGGFSGSFGASDFGGGFDFGVSDLSLAGFAGGTDGAPGGWARINERGPEGVAFLPPGTKVIPNDVLRGLSQLKVSAARQSQSVSNSFSPTLNVSVNGAGMSGADARRTGSQIGSAAMKQMAMARKAGI